MSALATKVGTPTPYYLLGLVKQFYRQPFTIANARTMLMNPKVSQEEAQRMMAHIKKINQQSPLIYRIYLSGTARRGDEEVLKQAVEEVAKIGLAGELRDVTAVVHATKKEAQPTLDLLSAMVNEKKAKDINIFDFSFIISKFWGDKEVMVQFTKLWEEMVVQGVRPNLLVANAFIKSFMVMDDEEGMKRYLEKMKQEGLQPNVQTYTAIIEGCVRKGRIEEVRKWMEDMKRDGLRPDQQSYAALVDYSFRNKDYANAGQLIEEMLTEGVRPDARLFSTMINEMVRQGDKEAAQHWRNEMMKAGWTPSQSSTAAMEQMGGRDDVVKEER